MMEYGKCELYTCMGIHQMEYAYELCNMVACLYLHMMDLSVIGIDCIIYFLYLQLNPITQQRSSLLSSYQTSSSELKELTVRWRKAAQEVAEDISSSSQAMHEHPVTVGQLLDLLHIPHSLLHYSEEEEGFID